MRIVFDKIKTWDALFEKWVLWDDFQRDPCTRFSIPVLRSAYLVQWGTAQYTQVNQPIGPYCSVDGHLVSRYSLAVLPTQPVIDFCNAHMLTIDRDVLNFNLTVRKDEVFVSVKYNQILGSRWLALLPHSEIPLLAKNLEEEE